MPKAPSRDLAVRLKVFVDRGMIPRVPTRWQMLQGELEMAPYVVMPDAGDRKRYAGAPFGHPVLRQAVVISSVGPEHFRIGSGLHTSVEALARHLMFVHHEGMPAYDLQLLHSVPGGLQALRRYAQEIEAGATPTRARQRRLIELVIPSASAYRASFLAPGGWLDRAEAFAYPTGQELPSFLRVEWTSLTAFANYCASAYPATSEGLTPWTLVRHLGRLVTSIARDDRAPA